MKRHAISSRSIERLSMYRRALLQARQWSESVYSHQIAGACGLSAVQVRRDLMAIGYSGSPNAGYDVRRLLKSIESLLDSPQPRQIAIVGVGYLGRAILAFLAHRNPKLVLSAAFDVDPAKVNRVIGGVHCHPFEQLGHVVSDREITLGIITVPAEHAQPVAEALVDAGVVGILNFAPVRLHLPAPVVVEHIDMTVALEKVAYFARDSQRQRKEP